MLTNKKEHQIAPKKSPNQYRSTKYTSLEQVTTCSSADALRKKRARGYDDCKDGSTVRYVQNLRTTYLAP